VNRDDMTSRRSRCSCGCSSLLGLSCRHARSPDLQAGDGGREADAGLKAKARGNARVFERRALSLRSEGSDEPLPSCSDRALRLRGGAAPPPRAVGRSRSTSSLVSRIDSVVVARDRGGKLDRAVPLRGRYLSLPIRTRAISSRSSRSSTLDLAHDPLGGHRSRRRRRSRRRAGRGADAHPGQGHCDRRA
jgi:hypothetical protein